MFCRRHDECPDLQALIIFTLKILRNYYRMEFLPENIVEYAAAHSTAEPEVLKRLNRETHARVLKPRMLSGHMQGSLLAFISRMLQPTRILEIGTYTGYSAICLSHGLKPGGLLHTIDHNPELEDFTLQFIREAGLEKVIIQHIGEALDVIPGLNEVFDLVFIDADKENYCRYFDLVLPKIRKGGVIIADNALWSGKVLLPYEEMDEETQGIADFNQYVHQHPQVRNTLLPFRDGLMLMEKISEGM